MWNFINLNSFKRQQMVKTNEQVSKDKLGTNTLNDVFLKIFLYPYDHISKFQEIGRDLTFTQSKIKIFKAEFRRL